MFKENTAIIKECEKTYFTVQHTAIKFGNGSQISKILESKSGLLNSWLKNRKQEIIGSSKNRGTTDKIIYEWLRRARVNKISISGPEFMKKESKLLKKKVL